MPSASQGLGHVDRAISGSSRFIHQGAPPASEAVITEIGDSGIIYAGHQFNGALYVKAVTAQVIARVEGRIALRDNAGTLIEGDWLEFASVTQALGTSSVTQIPLADGVDAPNQFRVLWSATGAGATSQVALTLG